MKAFIAIVKRDLQLAIRQGIDSVMVVAFFILAVMLFPIGVGPEANILARIAAGVIWVAALLSSMLSLERLFQIDYEDGSLELLALQPSALEITVMAKITAHWLTTGLPLLIATPLLAVFMNLPNEGFCALVLTLAIGTPSLSLIGAIGAALILGSRRGGVLLSLLVLPLYIPILIFGVSAIDGAISGFSINAHLLIMSGIFLAALPLCLWAGTGAIRQALET
jgi:heme exporter protein B